MFWLRLVAVFWVFSNLFTSTVASCYYPNGLLAPQHMPCRSIAKGITFCCAPGWTCLDNKLCTKMKNGHQNYTRASCTDATWQSQICPQFCLATAWTSNPMTWCGSAFPDTYCCDSMCDCKTRKDGVQLFAPTNIISVIAAMTSTNSQPQSATSGSATADAASSQSASNSALVGATGNSINTTAVAIGVVIPVVIIALIIGAYLFYRNRRKSGQTSPMMVAEMESRSKNNTTAHTGRAQQDGRQEGFQSKQKFDPQHQIIELGRTSPTYRHEMSG